MKNCVIYGLYSSRNDELRYIGQTTNIKARLSEHICHAKNKKTPVNCWMRRELNDGFKIYHRVIIENAVFNFTEIEVISEHRSKGARLLNVAAGGLGVLGGRGTRGQKRPDAAIFMRGNKFAAGRKWTDERRVKMSSLMKGRVFSEEHKKRISVAKMGHPVSEATRAKIRSTFAEKTRANA